LATIVGINVEFEVEYRMAILVEEVDTVYTSLVQKLNTSIASGEFATTLTSKAQQFGAGTLLPENETITTTLVSATDPVIAGIRTIAPTGVPTSNPTKAPFELTSKHIAAIIIGAFLLCTCIGSTTACVYYRKESKKEHFSSGALILNDQDMSDLKAQAEKVDGEKRFQMDFLDEDEEWADEGDEPEPEKEVPADTPVQAPVEEERPTTDDRSRKVSSTRISDIYTAVDEPWYNDERASEASHRETGLLSFPEPNARMEQTGGSARLLDMSDIYKETAMNESFSEYPSSDATNPYALGSSPTTQRPVHNPRGPNPLAVQRSTPSRAAATPTNEGTRNSDANLTQESKDINIWQIFGL
jgi:hypothetical protein